MDQAVRQWTPGVVQQKPQVIRIGYHGSYARGDWGVGSDLDLVAIVDEAEEPFARRAAGWDVTDLSVPAEVLVYTAEEWNALEKNNPFGQTVNREAVWVYVRTVSGLSEPV